MAKPRFGVIVFPGSNCEQDVITAARYLDADARYVWHGETDLSAFDAIVVPGGFAYGDYLRTGAVAAFSPVMEAVREFSRAGKPVIGICNGFQILCEAGLLPGALRRNSSLKFLCKTVSVEVATTNSPFTHQAVRSSVLAIPINHFEGNYYADERVLGELRENDRIAFRYRGENPNGSIENIAGILSEGRNVLGMMPHPERACDPAVGETDGQVIFNSMMEAAVGALA